MTRRGIRGFTLLEVMVALAIVSIGLIAAFNAVIQMAHSTAVLRERALADWIAMNEITRIRISGNFPEVGSFDGDVEFAGLEWRWEADISETGVADLRRIDLSVAHEERPDEPVTIVSGFVARGFAATHAYIDWWGASAPAGGRAPGDDDQAPDEPDAVEAPEPPEEEDEE
ncbi:MAG TPA: type II secretion system minor pseudopilin GspI [Gammaproteobacteria bacterium]|nr:type II secretion system minor pseudopilin GspI [Gammaproteobacteria bacterium]